MLRLLIIGLLTVLTGCATTTHPVMTAHLGHPSSSQALEEKLTQAGPIELQTINSADWAVPLSGLINLKSPQAKAAGLKDHEEPIHIYAHLFKHPQYGYFLIDSGVSQTLIDHPSQAGLSWLVQQVMPISKIHVRKTTADILHDIPSPLAGVFFTHLHFDHIAGLADIPNNVPLYVGSQEATKPEAINMFVQGSTNHLLAGKSPLQEWSFQPDPQQQLAGVIDVFGDGSVFAIRVAGHTAGSTAYLLRTTQGPVLLTGDTCHTRWGWEHGVEPGSFTRNHDDNLRSLLQLKQLVARHPQIQVRLGHQP